MASAGDATRFWSFDAPPRGRTPGVTRSIFGPTSGRMAGSSIGERIEPGDPGLSRDRRPARDGRSDALRVSGLAQIGVVIRSEDGDGEDVETRIACALTGRAHRLLIAVHGEEIDAAAGDLPRRALDRRADVVQLQIEKDALAGVLQSVSEIEPAGEGELEADLIEDHAVAELLDERARRLDIFDVERDDQRVAGIHACGVTHRYRHTRAGGKLRRIGAEPLET